MTNQSSKQAGPEKTEPEKTPVAQHGDIAVWNMERWLYEDLVVGAKTRSIRRTISEGEAMLFNCLVMDLHPYVADAPFAQQQGVFGKRLVAGAQVFSYGLGLFAHNNTQTFSYGYDRLRFIRPVFIGDTIYGIRTILFKQARKPDMGVMKCSYEIFKVSEAERGAGSAPSPHRDPTVDPTATAHAEQVLYCEHLQTVAYRDPSTFIREGQA